MSRLTLFILVTATVTCMLAISLFSWNSPPVVPDIPIIAVMGKTGAGKSTFIDALGGRSAITGKRPDIGHGLGSSITNL
jgi:GTP-binding protein EngB required for normal cell division